MKILFKAALISFIVLLCLKAFPQETKKAQAGTYQIIQSSSKQEIALAEEILYAIEEKRKDSENVVMYLPIGIDILIFSSDSVKIMKLRSAANEIIPKK